jgi:hypothetical protein
VAHLIVLAIWEAEIGRITVRGQSRQIVLENPVSKTNRAKWSGGVAQVEEGLFCKCKALISNPSPTKKKKKLSLRTLIKCMYLSGNP